MMEDKTHKRVSKRTITSFLDNTQDFNDEEPSFQTENYAYDEYGSVENIIDKISEEMELFIQEYADNNCINIGEFVTRKNLSTFIRK